MAQGEVLKALPLLLLVALLSGCATTTTPVAPDTDWPAYGWDTNAPSLDPVTNTVPAPVWPTNYLYKP
jgi:hypothetical protein